MRGSIWMSHEYRISHECSQEFIDLFEVLPILRQQLRSNYLTQIGRTFPGVWPFRQPSTDNLGGLRYEADQFGFALRIGQEEISLEQCPSQQLRFEFKRNHLATSRRQSGFFSGSRDERYKLLRDCNANSYRTKGII